ncbi:hypothetical protein, partial [Escherichia coli]|uniref:hypothetical protein n=1 Tax=Escherichia coli TaxID=562 RepID=UPI001BDDBCB3
ITVSVGMVRVIICHQLNTKNNIISGSEVSRLSVAIHTCLTLAPHLSLHNHKNKHGNTPLKTQ